MYLICGFLIGLFLPAIAGRFGKILPADPGAVLLYLWHRPRFPKAIRVDRIRVLRQKWYKLIQNSIVWAVVLAIVFYACHVLLIPKMAIWGCVFCAIIGYCMVIDDMYCLLPDFFTFPAVLLGFLMISQTGVMTPFDAIAGGFFGYLISTAAVFALGLFRRAELGFGDIKMMSAFGVWLGIYGLNFTLILSFFFFAIQSAACVKRSGPYGPALGLSAVITFFLIYMK